MPGLACYGSFRGLQRGLDARRLRHDRLRARAAVLRSRRQVRPAQPLRRGCTPAGVGGTTHRAPAGAGRGRGADAFIVIWQRAGTYDAALGSARAWIYTIGATGPSMPCATAAARTCGTRRRSRPRTKPKHHYGCRGAAPTESRLRRCLERLEPEKRECVLLSYVTGLLARRDRGAARHPARHREVFG